MLGTLLESAPRPQRRFGGTAASIAVHATLIALGVMATVREGTSGPAATTGEITDLVVPQEFDESAPGGSVGKAGTSRTQPPIPTAGPPIEGLDLPSLDDLTGPSTPALDGELTAPFPSKSGTPGVSDGDGALPIAAVDRTVIALAGNRAPDYPTELRLAGIEGSVRARFIVDTLGRVEAGSLAILESDHARFTDAVARAVPGMRFHPAEAGGRKARMLVEMPFVFRIVR